MYKSHMNEVSGESNKLRTNTCNGQRTCRPILSGWQAQYKEN